MPQKSKAQIADNYLRVEKKLYLHFLVEMVRQSADKRVANALQKRAFPAIEILDPVRVQQVAKNFFTWLFLDKRVGLVRFALDCSKFEAMAATALNSILTDDLQAWVVATLTVGRALINVEERRNELPAQFMLHPLATTAPPDFYRALEGLAVAETATQALYAAASLDRLGMAAAVELAAQTAIKAYKGRLQPEKVLRRVANRQGKKLLELLDSAPKGI